MSGHESNLPYCCEPLIGGHYEDERTGKVYRLIGIMLSADDWDYVLWRAEGDHEETKFLSCVGDPEAHGYRLVSPVKP